MLSIYNIDFLKNVYGLLLSSKYIISEKNIREGTHVHIHVIEKVNVHVYIGQDYVMHAILYLHSKCIHPCY